MSHGKQYRNARAGFDREELYSPVQAIRLLKGSRLRSSTRPSRRISTSA